MILYFKIKNQKIKEKGIEVLKIIIEKRFQIKRDLVNHK